MQTAIGSSIVRCSWLVMATIMVALSLPRVDATIVPVAAVAGLGGNTVRTTDGDNGAGTWLGGGASQWLSLTDSSFTGTVVPGPTEFVNASSTPTGTAPALTMTIGGLDSRGIYNVYVIYQTDDTATGGSTPFPNAEYNIQAGISSSSLSVFNDTSGGYTGGHRLISGGPRSLNEREVLVGTEIGSSVSLFIADYTGLPSGHDNETRWEGLGYELIGEVPEPSTVLLAGSGALLVVWRRRRQRTGPQPTR